jgi:hypothetical protein
MSFNFELEEQTPIPEVFANYFKAKVDEIVNETKMDE